MNNPGAKYGMPLADYEKLVKKYKKCVYCQRRLVKRVGSIGPQGKAGTVEHLDYRGNSGSYVAMCCGSCNSSRGKKPLLEWFEMPYCAKRNITEKRVHPIVRKYIRDRERSKSRV